MLKKVLVRSHDVIAHPIEDELVVISIPRHPGELGKGALSLNRTARDIWEKLDGTKTLMQVVKDISEKAEAAPTEVEEAVLKLATQLVERGLLIEG